MLNAEAFQRIFKAPPSHIVKQESAGRYISGAILSQVTEIIKEHKKIRRKDLIDISGIKYSTVDNALSKLEADGVIDVEMKMITGRTQKIITYIKGL